jgi:hypothetical protein
MYRNRPKHYEYLCSAQTQRLPGAQLTGASLMAIERFHLWKLPRGTVL